MRLTDVAATEAAGAALGAVLQVGDVVAVPGVLNKIMASGARFTPRPVMRRLVHKMQATKPDKH